MNDFMVIEVKSIWVRLSGRIWRLKYRAKAKLRRMYEQSIYRALKIDRRPKIYRVEIR